MLPEPILLSRPQIDAQAWDNHIHHSRQCVIYALSWYLDIVCEQWQALVWPCADRFSIVMPLPIRFRFGVRVLYQPLLCQYLGIFSNEELTARQCAAFLGALKTHFSYISNYAFNPENFESFSGISSRGFTWEVFQTHWLHLDQPYSSLLASYSKDRRANLQRGRREAWEITESNDFEPLISLFIANHAQRIGKINPEVYRTLKTLGDQCIQTSNGRLMYARTGARVRAGVLLVRYHGRTVYLFNAADHAGRKGNARAVMLDKYFRDHAGTEAVFDFESPQIASIAKYYASFGAMEMPFYNIKRNALPFPFRQMQALRKWPIRTRRCLFSNLCRILNPFPRTRF